MEEWKEFRGDDVIPNDAWPDTYWYEKMAYTCMTAIKHRDKTGYTVLLKRLGLQEESHEKN